VAGLSKKEKDKLVVGSISLIRKIASSIARNLPGNIDADDLFAMGIIGATEAVEKFDPSMGFPFATFARPRITGAIYDGIRREGWVPRDVLEAGKNIAKTKRDLTKVKGREPTREEMAKAMGKTPEQYDKLVTKSAIQGLTSLDQSLGEEDEGMTLAETVASSSPTQVDVLEGSERERQLMAARAALTPQQRNVLYYLKQGFTLRDIGEEMNLSESRVGAIKAEAIAAMQDALRQVSLPAVVEGARPAEPVVPGVEQRPTRLLTNPRGRPIHTGRLIHVGSLGERVHMMNPETGRALCAPHNFDVRPADGNQVTCYRCQKLMAVNRALRGSDIAVGTAKPIVQAASARRKA
jgi:RNA polymerase sigma factor for flagellar operon FliA